MKTLILGRIKGDTPIWYQPEQSPISGNIETRITSRIQTKQMFNSCNMQTVSMQDLNNKKVSYTLSLNSTNE